MKIKIIAGLLLVSGVLSLGWGWHATHQNLKAEKRDRQLSDAKLAQLGTVLTAERAARVKLEAARAAYSNAIEGKQNEVDNLRRDLERGPKRVFVRATCPAVPGAATDAAGAVAGAAELDPTARRAYLDLRAGIHRVEALLGFCRKELANRSAP